MIQNINWYPGHMKKTRELIQQNLKMVDAVVEVVDARIPSSSRNPIIDELVKSKKRIIILNKSDLSDAEANKEWEHNFKEQGNLVLTTNCMSGAGAQQLLKLLGKLRDEKNEGQVRQKPYRLMIVGVPNVGKSSLINRLTGKKSAQTGDRPGVTKGKQWLNLPGNMQLLDTPGILWPKFEDQTVGEHLAFTGAVKDKILDTELLAMRLLEILSENYPELLTARYGELDFQCDSYDLLCQVGKKRGMMIRGGETNTERAANMLLEEYRNCKIGLISLESVENNA